MNTPIVSHPSDTNLEESEDEDDLPSPSQVYSGDALQHEISLILEEDEIENQDMEYSDEE